MLTDSDVQWIKANRKEIEQNRTVPLILFHESKGDGYDPITGLPIKLPPEEEEVEGTFRRITSQGAGGTGDTIFMIDGVVAEPGNAITNIDISVDVTDVQKVLHVNSGIVYSIKARDVVGLGEDNRNFILLERVT